MSSRQSEATRDLLKTYKRYLPYGQYDINAEILRFGSISILLPDFYCKNTSLFDITNKIRAFLFDITNKTPHKCPFNKSSAFSFGNRTVK